MRVAVTGATGNVGTAVIDALAADPLVSSVVALARRPARSAAQGVEPASVDVSRDDLTERFRGVDAVVHLAWKFQPTHRPEVTWRTNVGGSRRVFEAVAAARVPALVYASSVGAYSPGPGRVVDESWPTDSSPDAAYGREKAYVERILDAFEATHPEVRVVRFRPAFIFREVAASEQRRIFAGPFVPNLVARPGRLPVLPVPSGLRFQAVHTHDVADAYRRAVIQDVRGPFNVATEPIIDGPTLARLLGAKPVAVPAVLVRGAFAAAWHARVVPAEPGLLALMLGLPQLDAGRARRELGWAPRHSGVEAIEAFLVGLARGAGRPEPPLRRDSPKARLDELRAGVGSRDLVSE